MCEYTLELPPELLCLVGDRPGLRPLQRRSHALPEVRFAKNRQTRGGTAILRSVRVFRTEFFVLEGENP